MLTPDKYFDVGLVTKFLFHPNQSTHVTIGGIYDFAFFFVVISVAMSCIMEIFKYLHYS